MTLMPIDYLRSSSMKKFEKDCQMAYFLEYTLGWRGESGKAATIGTTIHKLYELLAKAKLARQNKDKSFYDAELDTEYKTEKILTDHEQLVEPLFNIYCKGYDSASWKKYTKIIDTGLNFFDPRKEQIIAIEDFFEVKLKDTILRGTIDLVFESGGINVLDYKTGGKKNKKGQILDFLTGEPLTTEFLEKDLQLLTYYYIASETYGEDIVTSILFLAHDKLFDLFLDKKKAKREIEGVYRRIKNCKKPKPNKSWKCSRMCSFGRNVFRDFPNGTMCETCIEFVDEMGLEATIKKLGNPDKVSYSRGLQ